MRAFSPGSSATLGPALAVVLLTGCGRQRAPSRAVPPHIEPGSPEPASSHSAARSPTSPPDGSGCPAGAEVLGDDLTELLGVAPADYLRDIAASRWPSRWVEVERREQADLALVALQWPGEAAALLVLAPRPPGWCVRAVWGYDFGGNGVELTILDVVAAPGGARLVVLDALAMFHDPVDSTLDPFEPRQVVLAFDATRSTVVVDTRDPGLEALAVSALELRPPDPAYPDDPVVVATGPGGTRRWRFAPGSWSLLETP